VDSGRAGAAGVDREEERTLTVHADLDRRKVAVLEHRRVDPASGQDGRFRRAVGSRGATGVPARATPDLGSTAAGANAPRRAAFAANASAAEPPANSRE